MSDVIEPLEKSDDLTQFDAKHNLLLSQLTEKHLWFRKNPKEKNLFIAQVKEFLSNVGQSVRSADPNSSADFVRRIASEWQLAFTTQLQVAQNVSAILEVGSLSDRSDRVLRIPESARMRGAAVESWVRSQRNQSALEAALGH